MLGAEWGIAKMGDVLMRTLCKPRCGLCLAHPTPPSPSSPLGLWCLEWDGECRFGGFFLSFPCPDTTNPTKTFDWSRDYMLRFQPLSASGVNFLLELK